ncbi:hypothetical protein KA005_64785, partial [bacterium]|nr:hypothetical protein [bacterium]
MARSILSSNSSHIHILMLKLSMAINLPFVHCSRLTLLNPKFLYEWVRLAGYLNNRHYTENDWTYAFFTE